MTMTDKEMNTLIKICCQLKKDVYTASLVIGTKTLAKETTDAAEALFKKSNAAYILALNDYLNLKWYQHPKLRYRREMQETLSLFAEKAQPFFNNTYTLNNHLRSSAEESDTQCIQTIKRSALEKPKGALATSLMKFTDFNASMENKSQSKKKRTGQKLKKISTGLFNNKKSSASENDTTGLWETVDLSSSPSSMRRLEPRGSGSPPLRRKFSIK